MASQGYQKHLKKVGLEGFAVIDECYGRTRRPIQSQRLQSSHPQVHQSLYENYFYYQNQQSYVCHVPKVYKVTTEAVTNYPGAPQHQYYGGRSVSERLLQVSVAKESVVSSSNEVRFSGGTMITDYRKNMPLRRAYY